MTALPSLRQFFRAERYSKLQDRLIFIISIIIQLALGLLFGHQYDMRIFMATGYLVANGQNPYIAQNLSAIFHNQAFQGMTSIGYPPPWALVLGLVYSMVYTWIPNLVVYNLAIKVPIIAANIGLAYLAAWVTKSMDIDQASSRRVWSFLMLNPLLFYFGSAWGQFDAIVACLAILSLVLLYRGKLDLSGALLALSVSFKPTSLPILPVALFFVFGKGRRQAIRFLAAFTSCVLIFDILPFLVFHWDPSVIFTHWNAHFTVGGGMSFMTYLELIRDNYQLPGSWWLLGLLWVPAMLVGLLFLRQGKLGLVGLLKKSLAFIMLFFLTRTWLSEQNVILVLPFMVILAAANELKSPVMIAILLLPLAFTILNTSPPQLLFLNFPGWMDALLRLGDHFRAARLIARTLLVIPWEIVGWWIIITCLSKRPTHAESQKVVRRPLVMEGTPWQKS